MGGCRACGCRIHIPKVYALSRQTISVVMLVLSLGGCFGPGTVPVSDRATKPEPRPQVKHYRVVHPGDTLYSIAFEVGLDYQTLAAWNGVQPPYLIKPGQRLRLTAPGPITKPARPSQPQTAAEPRTPSPSTPAQTSATQNTNFVISKRGWVWPAKGKVSRRFSVTRGSKGIDIVGQHGQVVRSAAAGRVVYAGSGLRGYGRLIIVKHNETFLSAYAHNRKILVREGVVVARGQPIAEMGSTGTNRVKLHFEIRRRGVPVDPLRYLPRR